MSRTLYLAPPSYAGLDSGAGARYQTRREVTSYWFPTWLAQPAALTPNSKLMDCAPHKISLAECLAEAKNFDHVIINTSTPTLKNDCQVAEAIKQQRPGTKIGFVGAHAMVLPEETLKSSWAIDWVGRKEFDYTCKEVAEGRDLSTINGLSYKDKNGKIVHNPERELIQNLDELPWVADVYKRDVTIENYFNGYLKHPYISLYTGRGCPALCTYCLWPQTIGGHRYRTRSAQNVAGEMAYLKKLFPQVREFFFDDDTLTANLPRAREIAKLIAPLGVEWSCNSRANLDYDTIKFFKDHGLHMFLVGFESGNDEILKNMKKGVNTAKMRSFTKACHQAGVPIHGCFMLGLPVETKETIEQTINFAKELDVFSIQVSLAAPYPGTELYEQAKEHGWFIKKSDNDLLNSSGLQDCTIEYPGITKEEIFESVDRFYRSFYMRPKPILRIVKQMLEEKDVLVRRTREGVEFFRSLRQRKRDLAAARAANG